MKINPDCVRDVMLYLEENIKYIGQHGFYEHSEIPPKDIINSLSKYTPDDVTYSIEKLIEAQYITIDSIIRGKKNRIINFNICSITYQGHQFLDNVRPQKFWEIAKNIFKNATKPSIEALAKGAQYAINLYITDPDRFQSVFKDASELIHKFTN